VADTLVAAALNFVRQNLHQPIRVAHLLADLGVSRRRLEQQYRKVLGRSIADEIHSVRLEHVKQMLRDTAEPVNSIAAACGCHHPEVLTRSFQRAFGLSPTEFRRQHRLSE